MTTSRCRSVSITRRSVIGILLSTMGLGCRRRSADRKWSRLAEPLLLSNGLPFQKLHDNEGLTFPFIDFMNGADVGVVETRRSAGLTLKSLQSLMISDQLCW